MSDQDDQTKVDLKSETGFQRSQLKNVIEVRIKLPSLYPSTIENPFTVYMRLQLVKEAEEIQSKFLMLSDDEQADETHEYDASMLSILSTKAPTGFADFTSVDDDPVVLRKAIYDYFIYAEGSPEEREGMAYICRCLLSKYRRTVNPTDYL